MKRWALSLVLYAVALIVVDQLFVSFYLAGFGTALFASILLSILNVIVKPLLVILTLPITILSLGLFLLIINAITLMIAQALMGPSFVIDGFGMAILASVVLSILQLLLNRLIRDTILLNK